MWQSQLSHPIEEHCGHVWRKTIAVRLWRNTTWQQGQPPLHRLRYYYFEILCMDWHCQATRWPLAGLSRRVTLSEICQAAVCCAWCSEPYCTHPIQLWSATPCNFSRWPPMLYASGQMSHCCNIFVVLTPEWHLSNRLAALEMCCCLQRKIPFVPAIF